ncbi:MAG TPA: FAD-binding oxidoreductase, partial [Acidocella sp.]|nr:FAD-binding oxidoreductase [Acidocella sp.]
KREGLAARLTFNAQSRVEFSTPRSWALDAPSPFEAIRVLDPPPNMALNKTALAGMRKLYPAFRDVKVKQHWAGYIDVAPDLIPYIGTTENLPGLVIATGFSGHGFGIGPAAGQLAAEIALGHAPSVDSTAFRVNRFADGTPIMLGAEL